MEEIKVGEYIKTVAGYIGKIISFNDGMYTAQMKDVTIDLYIDDIKNHKENIIDLIEEGDYVNGYKVEFVQNNEVVFNRNHPYKINILADEVKSIVTKQQFNQMKYTAGDESNE